MHLYESLNLISLKYNNSFYLFDCVDYNLFHISNIMVEVAELYPSFSPQEVVSKLKQSYDKSEILKEYHNLDNLISTRKLSGNVRTNGENYGRLTCDFTNKEYIMDQQKDKQIMSFEKQTIIFLNISDFNDDLLETLDRTSAFLVINLNESEFIEQNNKIKRIKDYISNRKERYRINVFANNDFLSAYNSSVEQGLDNFDIILSDDYLKDISTDEVNLIRNSLMNSFSKNNLPSLGIIKDIIRIIALKKTNRMDNSKCWAKNMCCNIKEQNKSKACEFFKMIYEIGIMYFVKFIADDHNQINNIIVNDLHSRLTIKEKSVLSKNFYWNNTLNSLSKSDIVKYQSSMLLMNYYNFSRGGIENELINCC